MEEATESAKRIREDIQEMRNKYGVVDSQEKCAACDFPLLNRPFYLFLCGHMFHNDCLLQVTCCTQEYFTFYLIQSVINLEIIDSEYILWPFFFSFYVFF